MSPPTDSQCDDEPMGYVLDLDGVLWLGDVPIPRAADAVIALRAKGERVLFVTNNSSETVAAQATKLARFGVPAEGDVVTSAQAAASLVEPAERVLVCAGPGVVEAMEQRGAVALREGPADAVVVGLHRDFDYERMRAAFRAVDSGARLISTNSDRTYPTPTGPIPGGGAIAASIAYAADVEPVVAGKPHQPMVDLVLDRLGPVGTVVGDRPETDGRFARALGYRWALVLTGVTARSDLPVDPAPDVVAESLAELVATGT